MLPALFSVCSAVQGTKSSKSYKQYPSDSRNILSEIVNKETNKILERQSQHEIQETLVTKLGTEFKK